MDNLSKLNLNKEKFVSEGLRLFVCAVLGIIGGLAVGALISWKYMPLATWDIAAVVFLIWIWLALYNRSAEQTAFLAVRENPGRAAADILLVLASIASLGGVTALLFESNKVSGALGIFQVALGTVSVIISWAVVHTVYALKYARLYYKNNGGIDFYSATPPCYADFAYVAFTIGMTFQISDNNFQSSEFRHIGLRHALLSFLFGTVIIATTINLIVGLGK